MIRRTIVFFLAWAGLMSLTGPAVAQGTNPLQSRGEQVLAMLRGQGEPEQMFTPEFLAQVPVGQLRAISTQLTGQYGAPTGLRVEAQSANQGVLHIETERGLLRMSIGVQAQPPHLISQLLVTGADVRGDTLEAVLQEIRALPGQSSVAVARLADGPQMLAAHEPDRALAIGSTFKLFILAELSRQVRAGERRWSDVVTLDGRSLPSGMLQTWPTGSPVTLHTLAAMMISISDNTATDALLKVVGRENVERMMTTIGVAAPQRNRPFLSTMELFALKTAPEADQRAFIDASEAERRRLLATRYASVDPDSVDASVFAGGPNEIDTLEWFASAADVTRTLDWLRRNGDETAHGILAISPGGPQTLRQDFAYIGYKGGSEPGVLNLTWLVRNREGVWHAVTGSWNNPAAPVEEARFAALMRRALQLVR
jgi:beta-lactamase class A